MPFFVATTPTYSMRRDSMLNWLDSIPGCELPAEGVLQVRFAKLGGVRYAIPDTAFGLQDYLEGVLGDNDLGIRSVAVPVPVSRRRKSRASKS